MRQSIAIDDFPGLMREWAEYAHSKGALGFSDSTTVWRAQFGAGGGGFASAPPLGLRLLEVHGPLKRLIDAMGRLEKDDDTKEPVAWVQWLYLYGPTVCLQVWGKSKTKLYEHIRTGEILIKREMKR